MKVKLKQVILATINSSDTDTRLVLREVSSVLLREYTVTELLDLLLSDDVNKTSVRFLGDVLSVTLDSDSSLLPNDKEKEAFKLFDALNMFWLHILEDYCSDDLNAFLDVTMNIYCDSLMLRKMVVTKVTRRRIENLMKSPMCKALLIMCLFSVDIGSILARGELPVNDSEKKGLENE